MRALRVERFVGFENLEVTDVGRPAPEEGESLIEVAAVGLSRSDLAVMIDRAGGGRPPIIPGMSIAGTVRQDARYPAGTRVALDPYLRCGRCARCRAGRGCAEPRVLGRDRDGGLADFVTTPGALVPLPRTMALHEGAAIAASGATAGKLLFDDAGLGGGERVLVTGSTGSLGLTVIQLATALGCYVAALVTRPDRVPLAELAGAAVAVAMDLRGGARAVEDLGQFDLIVHLATDVNWIGGLLTSLRPGGRVVMRRVRRGCPVAVDVGHLAARGITLVGSSGSGTAGLATTVAALASSSVRPVIDSVHDWEDHRAGLERFARRSSQGSVVVAVN